jgi:hypothetical protein
MPIMDEPGGNAVKGVAFSEATAGGMAADYGCRAYMGRSVTQVLRDSVGADACCDRYVGENLQQD